VPKVNFLPFFIDIYIGGEFPPGGLVIMFRLKIPGITANNLRAVVGAKINPKRTGGHFLHFYPSIFYCPSPIKTLFPLKKNVGERTVYFNKIDNYDENVGKLISLLKEKPLGTLVARSYRDNLKISGTDRTLHSLMDFVCFRSLKHNFSPMGDYFEMVSLPSKLSSAGWSRREIDRTMKIMVPVKSALDAYFIPYSKKIEAYNIQLSQIPKSSVSYRENIKREKEEALDATFRDTRYGKYREVLSSQEIVTAKAKKRLCKTILRVLYAQRNLEADNTLGRDIRTTYSSAKKAIEKMDAHAASYFKEGTKGPSKPTYVFLLGDGEILDFMNKLSGNHPSRVFLLTRKMLLSGEEWSQYTVQDKKRSKWNITDHGSVFSVLYNSADGRKSGIYIDAYKHAVQNGKDPGEIMTLFNMKFTELFEQKMLTNPLFRETMNKLSVKLNPLINISGGSPLVFCDAGLKGNFVATLSSLTELQHRKNNEPSIFTQRPTTSGFIFSIDEDYPNSYPHYSVGINDCMLMSDTPRFSFYQRNISFDGTVPSRPAHNMLALIYYKTFMELHDHR
jgi:hypothetical protein